MLSAPQWLTAGELGTFRGGSGFPTRFQGVKSGDLPFFKVSDMNKPGNELYMRRANNYISEAQRKALSAVRVPAGAIVFAKVGAAIFLERKRILAQDSCIDNNMAAFIVDGGRIDTRFAHFLLTAFELSSLVATTALPSLNGGQLRSIPLLIPETIGEQRRIANVLADADDLVSTLKQVIVKRELIKRGMMQQLLTGQTRLPGYRSSWSRSTVGEVAEVKTGPFGSALHESDYVRRGTPIITVEHLGDRGVLMRAVPLVSDADRRRLSAYTLRAGDVVFSRVGAIDRNALISEREAGWLFSGRLLRVRFDRGRVDPGFMSAQFHSRPFREAVRSAAVGQTMASLNTSILRGIAVDVPPLEEQVEIGRVVRDINDALDGLDHQLAKAQGVRNGMMQELLTAHTRLPGVEASA